jgi:hypothetical protein
LGKWGLNLNMIYSYIVLIFANVNPTMYSLHGTTVKEKKRRKNKNHTNDLEFR